MNERDQLFMQTALKLAKKGLAEDEIPVGALVVNKRGDIIGKGYNQVQEKYSQVYHAEMNALMEAGQVQKDWRLEGCTLYVTLEPCMMCISACALSRVERVVYGADSPLFGYHLDTEGVLQLYTKQIKNITAGVCRDQSAELLKAFFAKKRGDRV